jgi:hypothetical protein
MPFLSFPTWKGYSFFKSISKITRSNHPGEGKNHLHVCAVNTVIYSAIVTANQIAAQIVNTCFFLLKS